MEIVNKFWLVRDRALNHFAWSSLRRFHNSEFVESHIKEIHGIKEPINKNISKQASQVRYCLVQAKEYFEAAKVSSLATKPVLLYYSIMSLALAEILIKQSGRSSLDKARDQNKHHGLSFTVDESAQLPSSEGSRLKRLIATPAVVGGRKIGTFHLWHKSARELPIVCKWTKDLGGGRSTTSSMIFAQASPNQLGEVRKMSLYDCVINMPGLADFCNQHRLPYQIVRGSCEIYERTQPNYSRIFNVIIHPGSKPRIDDFFSHCLFEPSQWDRVDFHEIGSGGTINWRDELKLDPLHFHIPHATMLSRDEVLFWPKSMPLNEFGFLYVALFISGNYARYFPDQWMVDIDNSSITALAIEEILRVAEERMALLALSELDRRYYIDFGV